MLKETILSPRLQAKRLLAFALALLLLLPAAGDAFAELQIRAEVLPDSASPTPVTVCVGQDQLWFVMKDGSAYLLSFADLPDIAEELFGEDLPPIPDAGTIDEDAAMKLAMRYGRILLKVVTLFNTTRKKTVYPLTALGVSPECTVITCKPSQKNWKKMLTSLFETASADEELAALLPPGAQDEISVALDNVDAVVAFLDGTSVQIAYDSDMFYGVRLANSDSALSYQSFGDLSSGQKDAVVLEAKGESTVLVRAETGIAQAAVPAGAVSLDAGNLFSFLSKVLPFLPELVPGIF